MNRNVTINMFFKNRKEIWKDSVVNKWKTYAFPFPCVDVLGARMDVQKECLQTEQSLSSLDTKYRILLKNSIIAR